MTAFNIKFLAAAHRVKVVGCGYSRLATAIAAMLGALTATPALAQEAQLNGLGWVKTSPGTQAQAGTQVTVVGNEAHAEVSASGGSVSALAGIGARLQLISAAQANSAGLGAVDARSALLRISGNRLTGFVNAVGGAASANVALVAGGAARKPLVSTTIDVLNNKAGGIQSIGGKADVLLGAVGSLQLPGRSTANSVLLSETDVRDVYAAVADNRAHRITSVGGAALANALTTGQSELRGGRFIVHDNQANDISATGGTGTTGGGRLASADLTAVTMANSTAVASSELRGARVTSTGNQADRVSATGGSALANSVNLEHISQVEVDTTQANNRASDVHATGGRGSLLGGAIAQVDKSATALANTVSVLAVEKGSHVVSRQIDNAATRVQAEGGGASANSVWAQGATIKVGEFNVIGNVAHDVSVSGGSGSVGGGLVGEFARKGRALANSVVLDRAATLSDSPVTLHDNQATQVRGEGGLAMANTLLAGESAQARGAGASFSGNEARAISATGYSGSLGGGLIGSASRNAAALANSVALFGSELLVPVLLFANRAENVIANGGKAQANSISLERGDGGVAQLAGRASLIGNTASQVSSGARSMAGPGHLVSSAMDARAAANALVLRDGAKLDVASTATLVGNTVQRLGAVGGTALVNTLALYRGAGLNATAALLAGNEATDVAAGGGYNQVAGVGRASNGVVAVNGIYLEGEGFGSVAARNSNVALLGNTARHVNAQGGRINANALAVNGRGQLNDSSLVLAGNTVDKISSQGSEGTFAGHAIINRGVGSAQANAVQVNGTVAQAPITMTANVARDVHASKGLAAANSVVVGKAATLRGTGVALMGNTGLETRASNGLVGATNSVIAEGSIQGGAVALTGNTGRAGSGIKDGLVNSVRVHEGKRLAGANVNLTANVGEAKGGGTANSLDARSDVRGSQVAIIDNRATVRGGGTVNSVVVERGAIQGGRIVILGNTAQVNGGGTANSFVNRGNATSANIQILGNHATANGGGTVNSVENRGQLLSSQIMIANNQGSTMGGGVVNSVQNSGVMSGRVSIVGNRGNAALGGTVNSVVNRGVMAGDVLIAGNRGVAGPGGTANSLINHGMMTGKVAIVGNTSVAGPAMTAGSVVNAGALVGAAAVTANVPSVANPGYTYAVPSTGVVTQSVTILPGVAFTHL